MSLPKYTDDTCEVVEQSQLKPGMVVWAYAWNDGSKLVKWLPVRSNYSGPLVIGHPTLGLLNGRVTQPCDLSPSAYYAIASATARWNGRCLCGARTFTLFSSVEHEGACR